MFQSYRETARITYRWHMTNERGDRRWALRFLQSWIGFDDPDFGRFTEEDANEIRAFYMEPHNARGELRNHDRS